MALVYSYIRFSTKKQLEGDSLRRQVESGTDWIRRNGHTLADRQLRDLGVSGYRGKNVETGRLGAFLEDCKAGRVAAGSILLVENLDRLSRQGMTKARKLFDSILDTGVHIATLTPNEQVFTADSVNADPMGLMAPLWAFHLAHLESLKKADRLRKLWDKKRAKSAEQGAGYKFDKRRPLWMDWDARGKVFMPNRWADAVRFIFDSTAEGTGQRRVLAGLAERFPGRRWNTSYVQKVLSDRSVLGERQPYSVGDDGTRRAVGTVITGYYPAVVDEQTWHRAQAAKANNRRMKGPNGRFVNLFTGLTFNAHDGTAMHMQTTRGVRADTVHVQRRLVSYGHLSKVPGSDGVTVPYYELETHLLAHLSEVRADDLGSKAGVSELRAREQELSGVETHLSRLTADMASAHDTGEYQTLRDAASIARGKRDAIKADVQRLAEELSADQPLTHAHDVLPMLADAPDDDARHTLRLRLRSLVAELVASIHLKPEKHFGRVFTLVQVTYRRGLVRQFGWGPGWTPNKSAAEECPAHGIDLRDREKCARPRLAKLAAALAQPAPAPTVTTIPDTVGAAAELFLQVRRSEMAAGSYRVVPSKVRRFVDHIGADTRCRDVTGRDWTTFVRSLKADVRDGTLARPTARVTHNRAREFVRWLVAGGACGAVDTGGSARRAMD